MIRTREKTPTELMVDINKNYLRARIKESGLNQSDLSVKMGYCPEYLSNSVHDGRMQIELLKWLSLELHFNYKDALAKKPKRKRKKIVKDSPDIFDFLDDVKH